ncbi:MAG: endonuclease/exonuclease/phosphatase family protein [Desulfobacterales bacterium]
MDQIAELAEATGMHMWAFGENYNFGLPFYRIVGGNAILSRFPIEGLSNMTLVGRQPFYVTKNNRRALWCSAHVGNQEILLASLHNDSYSRKNNLAQAQQILAYVGNRDAILAGDFNAAPHEPPMKVFSESRHFSGVFDGPFTFPAGKPKETIDFILGPASWEVLEHRVIASDASDHLPVLTVFGIKQHKL